MDGRYVTKFGGNKPFIPDNFTWPKCKECKEFITFVCQINLATLPSEFQDTIKMSSGMLQIFNCNGNDCTDREEEVNIIPKTDFVPSLQSLSAEALVNPYVLDDYNHYIEIRGQEVDIRDILPKPILEFVKNMLFIPLMKRSGLLINGVLECKNCQRHGTMMATTKNL